MSSPVRVVALLLGLCLMVAAGRVSFDLTIGSVGIPITGQSLAVLLVGSYGRQREILLLFAIYLIGGGLGMPFFADGAGGVEHLVGKSGGYLYSFPLAALLVARYRSASTSNLLLLLVFLAATALMLLLGMLHLSYYIGVSGALTYGVYPFLLGGGVKCLMAWVIVGVYDKMHKFSFLYKD